MRDELFDLFLGSMKKDINGDKYNHIVRREFGKELLKRYEEQQMDIDNLQRNLEKLLNRFSEILEECIELKLHNDDLNSCINEMIKEQKREGEERRRLERREGK